MEHVVAVSARVPGRWYRAPPLPKGEGVRGVRTRSRPSFCGGGCATLTTVPCRLSKSRFTSGLQCHKKLWWEVHEPDALELQPDKVLQDLFDQGRQVGEAARARYPGGVLIDLPHHAGAA